MSPAALKFLHIGSVAASYTLFFLRGVWLLRGSAVMQQRWVRFAPHLVDTVLLASAIALAVQLSLSPLGAPWLLAKVVALLLYIVLGEIAIRGRLPAAGRFAAWTAAQGTFFYIAAVALTKQPLPWQ